MLQTAPTRPQRTTTPTTLAEQLAAHPKGRRRGPQDDIKRKIMQHRDKLTGEWATEEARLADLVQRKSTM
jgi:hypothetical protein